MKKKILNLLLIGILALGLTGCGKSDNDKMINYLESENFNCNFDEQENVTVCTKVDENIIERISLSNHFSSSINGVNYTLTSKNEYEIKITNGMYKKNNYHAYYVIVRNLYDKEYSCYYYPDYYDSFREYDDDYVANTKNYYNSFKVGDNVKSDSCEYDFSKKVNQALRNFEKYFEEAGIKLAK